MDGWLYTIRIGFGRLSEAHDPICAWQIVDDLGEPLHEGTAEDVPDAITKVAAAILSVHDPATGA